jgi:uncharacterized membrane protein HdeD (DUF308 family)
MRNMLRYSGMEVSLAHLPGRWIALVLRGAVAIAAGIAALVVSAAAAKTVLALYLAVDGVLTLNLAAHMGTRRRARALIAIDGVADLAAAAVLFLWVPDFVLLILVVAMWAIATGLLEIVASIFMPRVPALAWTIAIVGLVSCLAGIVAFDWTGLAEIGLLYLFGAYAVIAGSLFLAVGVLLARAFRSGG